MIIKNSVFHRENVDLIERSKRVDPPLRFITSNILILIVSISIGFQILRIVFPSYLVHLRTIVSAEESRMITYGFWVILIVIVLFELLNIILINQKAALLTEEEINYIIKDSDSYSDGTLVMIPALDEELSIKAAIQIGKTVGKVLVINDGSKDSTKDIAMEFADHVISHSKNLGLATAIMNGVEFGIKNKFNEFVIFDADCQYTQHDLENVVKVLRNSKADLVMGSRLTGTIHAMPKSKRFGNYLFSKVLTYITRIPISDGQTGLRAFTSTFASTIQFRGTFTYTQEMLFEASRNRFDVLELPITFREREYGESRLMRHAIDYAVRAWALNLQIIAEYNPLKFTVYVISGFYVVTFLSNNGAFANLTNSTAVIIVGLSTIMFLIGIYAAVIIRKFHHFLQKPIYQVVK